MDTNTEHTGPEAIEEARRLLAEHEAAEQAAREEAARQQAQEEARRSRRRSAWAQQHYGKTGDTEVAEARKAARQAQLAFAEALAESSWFQALIEWQQKELDATAAHNRNQSARALAEGLSSPQIANRRGLVNWWEGRPRFDDFWRIVDNLLQSRTTYDPMGEVDELIAAPDAEGDPLTSAAEVEPDA